MRLGSACGLLRRRLRARTRHWGWSQSELARRQRQHQRQQQLFRQPPTGTTTRTATGSTNVDHRKGVAYRDTAVQNRYQNPSSAAACSRARPTVATTRRVRAPSTRGRTGGPSGARPTTDRPAQGMQQPSTRRNCERATRPSEPGFDRSTASASLRLARVAPAGAATIPARRAKPAIHVGTPSRSMPPVAVAVAAARLVEVAVAAAVAVVGGGGGGGRGGGGGGGRR